MFSSILRDAISFLFQLNIGCTDQFSSSAPVLLQYSHDAGLFWSLVKEGCYPASPGVKGCEGHSRELAEPTMYYTGDFEDWTRITIVIPRSLATRYSCHIVVVKAGCMLHRLQTFGNFLPVQVAIFFAVVEKAL